MTHWVLSANINADEICKKRVTNKYISEVLKHRSNNININIMNDVKEPVRANPFITREQLKITIPSGPRPLGKRNEVPRTLKRAPAR